MRMDNVTMERSRVHQQAGAFGGEIYPVVDVKAGTHRLARTRLRRTSLLSAKIQRSGQGRHRGGGAFVVVADGGGDGGSFPGGHTARRRISYASSAPVMAWLLR